MKKALSYIIILAALGILIWAWFLGRGVEKRIEQSDYQPDSNPPVIYKDWEGKG